MIGDIDRFVANYIIYYTSKILRNKILNEIYFILLTERT